MLVQVKGVAFRCAEDARGYFVQHALRRQRVYGGGTGVGRADLQQEIRPQPRLFDQRVLNELPRPCVSHDEERAHEVTVVGKDSGVEIKDAHVSLSEDAAGKNHCAAERIMPALAGHAQFLASWQRYSQRSG
jgi:hypothetical protein